MKVVKKKKKSLIGIGTVLSLLPIKVFARSDSMMRISPAYGVQEPVRNNLISSIWNICRMFIIPIALLIGIIIYLKKSKSSKRRKIITALITIGIVATLDFIINYIIYNLI